MRNPEMQRNPIEKLGATIRNIEIVAGVIGLIVESANLLAGGAGLVVSGEIFRGLSKKPQQKIA